MAKKKTSFSKEVIDHDQKIIKPNPYLKTQKSHKDWYDIRQMGKQQQRPRLAPKEKKKPSM